MKIGDLARETGVSPRLLRYYEEQGLLASERLASGHRRYPQGAPDVVRHIRTLLAAGLPSKVIRDVLPCVNGSGPTLDPCVITLLRDQLHTIEDRITGLQQTRNALATLLIATESNAA